MKTELATKLIEIGAIRQGTEIQAHLTTIGLSGKSDSNVFENFIVTKATRTPDGKLFFYAVRPNTTWYHRFECREIITIDGMDEERIAKSYNLTITGTAASMSKRRGRKPNTLS